MKKIGLVVCYDFCNYGSILQSYATQVAVESMGYDSEVIALDKIRRLDRQKKIHYYVFDEDKKKLWEQIKKRLDHKIAVMFCKTYRDGIHARNHKFRLFSINHFKISEICTSLEELGQYCEKFDKVLVGSDQLWLPSNIISGYWTLEFVPEGVGRISYSTSFGISKIPDKLSSRYEFFLKRFQSISVREQSGVMLVNRLAHREAAFVCDPTMLLSDKEWNELIPHKTEINETYIFCYFLGNSRWHRKAAEALREKTGFKLAVILHCERYAPVDSGYADFELMNIGIEEFVNLIRHAELVLTDSFHGTVFSIINQKRFLTFKRFLDSDQKSTNSRIVSLLQYLNLEGRIINSKDDINRVWEEDWDYQQVTVNVENFRKESKDFLFHAIEREEKKGIL